MDDETKLNKEKLGILNQLLNDEYVLVHVNTRTDGLNIPENLTHDPMVTLKLSRWFRGGLDITEERISADLLFSDDYFTCLIPLPAIWGVTGAKGQNLIWPTSAPEDVLKGIKMLSAVPASPATADQAASDKPELPPNVAKKKPASKTPRPTGHLKRIK